MLSYFKLATATLITLITISFAQDVTLTIDGTSLNYESTADIYGFQFNHDGCAIDASGGDAAANGFTISASSGVVLAFSFTGSFIPAGSGTLVDLGGECATLSGFVFSGSGGAALEASFDDGSGGSDADHTVDVGPGMSFTPADLNVAVGETVEWVWIGGTHNVNGSTDTFPNNPDSFDSGDPESDATYSFTFAIAGHYDYQCDPHVPYMIGTVTVGSGGCTEEWACNYDADADFDDGSCEYPPGDECDCDGNCTELGCTDSDACNYDASATDDDGSCTYAEENEDCDGSCTVEVDCAGECGGSAVEDECGVCDGSGAPEYYDCEGNCIAGVDCQGICGGPNVPTTDCADGRSVCYPSDCNLAINNYLLPQKFDINRIYPNPFNPQTTIEYEISVPANIWLGIYNIRGQKITVLAEGYTWPGWYSSTWNGTNFPSGIYFVILNNQYSIIRRKIILLK